MDVANVLKQEEARMHAIQVRPPPPPNLIAAC